MASAATQHLYVVDAWVGRGASGSGLWRPTTREALAARAALRRYLASSTPARLNPRQAKAARRVAASFGNYVIQAEGVRMPDKKEIFGTEGKGPKQIHLDGFCQWIADADRNSISRQMIVMFDGDECIFEAMYDIRSRKITFLAVHGS